VTLVVREHQLSALEELGDVAQQAMTDLDVALHLAALGLVERARLEKDDVVRADLADVVDARRVVDELDLRALELHPPREAFGERGDALRVAVRVRVAQVDEVGELEDRGARLLPDARGLAQRQEHRAHRHGEEDER
jgi:hypothetical protein